MWNGSAEKSIGTARLKVTNQKKRSKHSVTFDIVIWNHKLVLGLDDILKMDLITVNLENFERILSVKTKGVQLSTKGDYVAAYPDIFDDTACGYP